MINFSNFKNHQQKSYKNKKVVVILLSIIIFICLTSILFIQAKQFKVFFNLKEQFHDLSQYIEQQNYIFDEKIALNKKLKALKNKKKLLFLKIFNIKNKLKIILKNIPKNCCVDEFLYLKNKNNIIKIKGKSKSWQSLSYFANILNNKIGKIKKHKQELSENIILYNLELII